MLEIFGEISNFNNGARVVEEEVRQERYLVQIAPRIVGSLKRFRGVNYRKKLTAAETAAAVSLRQWAWFRRTSCQCRYRALISAREPYCPANLLGPVLCCIDSYDSESRLIFSIFRDLHNCAL